MNELINIEPQVARHTCRSCRTCKHLEKWQCGGSIIQYCGVIKSNRTENGLKKIKVTNPPCQFYEEEEK